MKFYYLIQALLMTSYLLNTSCFSMKENEIISNNEHDQEKEIIQKPGFKEIGDHEITEKNNDKDEKSSEENTDDIVYEKRHLNQEKSEKKRNKQHKNTEKRKRNKFETKFEKNKKENLCWCYQTNKLSIQCEFCKQWHQIPKEKIKQFDENQNFFCFNNTWNHHVSEQCSELNFFIENLVEKEENK